MKIKFRIAMCVLAIVCMWSVIVVIFDSKFSKKETKIIEGTKIEINLKYNIGDIITSVRNNRQYKIIEINYTLKIKNDKLSEEDISYQVVDVENGNLERLWQDRVKQ